MVWFGLVLRFGRQFCGKYIKHLSHLAICMPGQLCNIFLHICGSLCHFVCIFLCVCVHCFLGQASSVGWAAIWEIPSWAAFLLPVTCYHLPFTCCPDTIKLQSCLVTNYAPVVVAVAVVAVVVVSTNFTRSKSIGSKGKKTQQQHTGQRQRQRAQ